jgi:hypothetical protein
LPKAQPAAYNRPDGLLALTGTVKHLTTELVPVPLPGEVEAGPMVLHHRFLLDWKQNLLVTDQVTPVSEPAGGGGKPMA